jgi:hypothetical protein
MDLRQGIIDAANALGINPADLATAISYETGGTFNPTQQGIRTKWGLHRGLIQFGEPQAQKYGVDWNNPVETQLGANGAVVRYLKDAGVRPGMSLLDVYSAINAGSVGQYRAMDMGTSVAQKVSSDAMRKHGEKAAALLGGEFTPDVTGTPYLDKPIVSTAAEAPDIEPMLVDINRRPRSLLADDLSASVASPFSTRRDSSRLTGPADPGGAVLPAPEFASANPVEAPSPAANPVSLAADAPLADLFKVKPIGQAAAIDPMTGAPMLTRSRRI